MLKLTALVLLSAVVNGQNPFEGAPNPGNDPCSVCGPGLTVGDPLAVWTPPIPGFAPVQCGLLEQAGLIGFINPVTECPAVASFIAVVCDCIPGEATLPPTDPPVAPVAPTDPPVAPTDPPVAPTDPPVAPTDPPVAPTDPPVAPTDPPVAPTDPPVAPPTDPPVASPTDPPVAPPTDPPVDPTDPPVAPPTDPPVAPPTDPPVVPPTSPPVVPPTAPPVIIDPTIPPVVDPTFPPVTPTAPPVTSSPVGIVPPPPFLQIDLPIFNIITDNDPVSIFSQALTQAGAEFSLTNRGPFTVFVPTNVAFGGIDLTGLSIPQLQDIILYHVIPGSFLFEELPGIVTSLLGEDVFISGPIINGNAQIVQPNIVGTNGVIHVIDGVLQMPIPLPPNFIIPLPKFPKIPKFPMFPKMKGKMSKMFGFPTSMMGMGMMGKRTRGRYLEERSQAAKEFFQRPRKSRVRGA